MMYWRECVNKWISLNMNSTVQGPVLLLRHDVVARLLANGVAAFIESSATIACKDCDSARSL